MFLQTTKWSQADVTLLRDAGNEGERLTMGLSDVILGRGTEWSWSFFLDLKIAIILSYIYYQLPSPNVGWLSEFYFSSNKFEISDWEKSTLELARFGIHKSFFLLLMISLSL